MFVDFRVVIGSSVVLGSVVIVFRVVLVSTDKFGGCDVTVGVDGGDSSAVFVA